MNAQEADMAVTETIDATEEIVEVGTYEPIEISALPESVTDAVSTDFAGATLAEAYKDEEDNYKLVLTVGEESKTVYTNATGEWIEPNE